jgi:thymidine kinase
VPVICYGLRTDFRTRLFDGSRRLLELADSIEEVKVTCQYCNRKAIFNMRLIDGEPTESGEKIQLGGNESYAPTCHACYVERLPGAIERAHEP